MYTIDFLMTTYQKSIPEIMGLIDCNHLPGNVLVGNQGTKDETLVFSKNGYQIFIFNQSTSGVSKNRNFLLKHTSSDFFMFLDDDVTLSEEGAQRIIRSLQEERRVDAYRFNLKSLNSSRPVKEMPSGKLGFWDLTSFGVWGIAFSKDVSYKMGPNVFKENIGPGTQIDHGEDTVMLRCFFKKHLKMIQIDNLVGTISQIESTWYGKNPEKFLFSTGYLCPLLFGGMSFAFLPYYAWKTKKMAPQFSFRNRISILRRGEKTCMEERGLK